MKYKPQDTIKLTLFSCWVLLLLGSSFEILAKSNDHNYELEVIPTKCLAVEQGKYCYATVKIKWQALKKNDYCLFSSMSKAVLQCWSHESKGNMQLDLKTKNNVLFFLRIKHSDKILISKAMKVVWVYKKNSRSFTTWRMF